jgi:hypothetical protein
LINPGRVAVFVFFSLALFVTVTTASSLLELCPAVVVTTAALVA